MNFGTFGENADWQERFSRRRTLEHSRFGLLMANLELVDNRGYTPFHRHFEDAMWSLTVAIDHDPQI